jgi:ribose/xylose/arabinose/galactoside ABC-type transport system permease subunit
VSGGRTTRSAAFKGALIGGLIGAALIGLGQAPEVNPTFQDFLKGAPIGLALGVVVGGGVGYALGGEKWLPGDPPR